MTESHHVWFQGCLFNGKSELGRRVPTQTRAWIFIWSLTASVSVCYVKARSTFFFSPVPRFSHSPISPYARVLRKFKRCQCTRVSCSLNANAAGQGPRNTQCCPDSWDPSGAKEEGTKKGIKRKARTHLPEWLGCIQAAPAWAASTPAVDTALPATTTAQAQRTPPCSRPVQRT